MSDLYSEIYIADGKHPCEPDWNIFVILLWWTHSGIRSQSHATLELITLRRTVELGLGRLQIHWQAVAMLVARTESVAFLQWYIYFSQYAKVKIKMSCGVFDPKLLFD